MFTGIVQGVASIAAVSDLQGIRRFEIEFAPGFCADLQIGASVAVDGVCLTVTELISPTRASFDVMLQSLAITTLGNLIVGDGVNVERAARDGAEIGGHPLSGHVDFRATVLEVRTSENNCCLRFAVPQPWMRYVFAKGYIALNGASLTVSDVDKAAHWFEVWLIPETRRMTTFESMHAGSVVNVEIERGTQVVVDTVRATLAEKLGALLPPLRQLLLQHGIDLEALEATVPERSELSYRAQPNDVSQARSDAG
jgi:riboflavin synthase